MGSNELNILVVEDDDFQRQMIVKALHSLNVSSICEVSDGKQALQIIRMPNNEVVDIVICDLNMPEMDGLEFLRFLGQEHHNISIIIISALGKKLLASAARMSKMYGVKLLGAIEKPILPDQLKDLFSKYEHSENKWHQTDESASFTLKEVLEGIRAKQFEPFFQPKVVLKTSQLTGVEAMARWIHPELGIVKPYAFIPMLEESSHIDELTFLMLQSAASACRFFHEKGCKIAVSVNLSLASLGDITLAGKITKIVRDAGLDSRYMILEITETAAMTEVAHALENLTRLCMNGFALSIDDYGSGYSSLQQLTRIAFSELKIDQSFVQDLANNEAARIVTKSSIDMARELKVRSVAEGVERQQDWDMLRNMGCDIAQGYFIAKPMNLKSFTKFCEENFSDLSDSIA